MSTENSNGLARPPSGDVPDAPASVEPAYPSDEASLATWERWAAGQDAAPVQAASEEARDCDSYIDDFRAPSCLRWFLLINRLPADLKALAAEMGVKPRLFASLDGKRVRVVMASRMGDVGVTDRLDAENGYSRRCAVADLIDFGDRP